jgi:hypothetical protein
MTINKAKHFAKTFTMSAAIRTANQESPLVATSSVTGCYVLRFFQSQYFFCFFFLPHSTYLGDELILINEF